MYRLLPRSLEPYVLCWGVCFSGVAVAHLALDGLTPMTRMGSFSLVAALVAALTVGTAAALLLGDQLEPPDLAGGGLVLAAAVSAALAAGFLLRAAWPPWPFWQVYGHVLLQRLPWAPLLLAAILPAVLLRLDLGEDEPFFDGRLRRACGYWLAAWAPPIVPLVLLRSNGTIVWLVTVPCALLLGVLGVRMREGAFHDRRARGRLGLVSAIGTAVFVALGTVRELAS